jgi:hypothetical protein
MRKSAERLLIQKSSSGKQFRNGSTERKQSQTQLNMLVDVEPTGSVRGGIVRE